MHLTDKEFIERFKKKEQKAFSEIIEAYSDRLYGIVYRMTGSRDDSLDILQNTFINAYKHADSFKEESSLYTYLAAIAINETRQHFRKEKKHIYLDLDYIDEERDIPTHTDSRPSSDVIQKLTKAIENLPDIYREVIVLKDIDGSSIEEISNMLNLSRSGIKVRLHRGRLLLKRMLKNEK